LFQRKTLRLFFIQRTSELELLRIIVTLLLDIPGVLTLFKLKISGVITLLILDIPGVSTLSEVAKPGVFTLIKLEIWLIVLLPSSMIMMHDILLALRLEKVRALSTGHFLVIIIKIS
jgi:hypothetical protein